LVALRNFIGKNKKALSNWFTVRWT